MGFSDFDVESYDKLYNLQFRLYCVWQTYVNGDEQMYIHKEAVSSEIYAVWSELNNILESKKGKE